jgi:hypothetical protein
VNEFDWLMSYACRNYTANVHTLSCISERVWLRNTSCTAWAVSFRYNSLRTVEINDEPIIWQSERSSTKIIRFATCYIFTQLCPCAVELLQDCLQIGTSRLDFVCLAKPWTIH